MFGGLASSVPRVGWRGACRVFDFFGDRELHCGCAWFAQAPVSSSRGFRGGKACVRRGSHRSIA